MAQKKTSTAPAFETIQVETHHVRCDGGGGALGHPMVYLEMGNQNHVVCPYCSRDYVLKHGLSH
ncbi:MAG: zinc-finger domain-containing protein [Proteobacteria bacterium]|nr:zinc-finger domain-containing protein [Pseudomonadota bacterium]